MLTSSADNTEGTLDYEAATTAPFPPITDFLLATPTFKLKRAVDVTDIGFDPTKTAALRSGGGVLKGLADLRLSGMAPANLVEAATSIAPIRFQQRGNTRLDLSIFGPPGDIKIQPQTPTNIGRPTFTWLSPGTDSVTGEVVSFEVRIFPDQLEFKSIPGGVTSFTPSTSDFPDPGIPEGPHTFQVRAVGSGDRQDTLGSLEFVIDRVPPGAPPLLTPPDNAFLNIQRPLFTWAASTGDVESYRIQVVESGDTFQGPFVINSGDLAQTQFLPTGDLADATYRWRVIARDIARIPPPR